MQKFSLGTPFCGQATPTKNKPTKIFTDKELVTIITVGFPHPQKFISPKIILQNSLTMRIPAFTVP